MEIFIAAISLGFLGSFHCIGMCGPIALALPIKSGNNNSRLFSIILYNTGRVITYALLGIVFGIIGASFSFFGFQQILSITLGVLILISVIIPKKYVSLSLFSKWVYPFFSQLKSKLSLQLNKKSFSSLFFIGLLNGLLPCGLVYMAIAGAIATGHIIQSSLFMIFFGLGTIPFMFSISFYSHLINPTVRVFINKSMPVIISVMAILLIVRGLNLGIPYLSPKMVSEKNSTHTNMPVLKYCHK